MSETKKSLRDKISGMDELIRHQQKKIIELKSRLYLLERLSEDKDTDILDFMESILNA